MVETTVDNFNKLADFLEGPIEAEAQEPPCEVCDNIETMEWKKEPHFYKSGIYYDPYYQTFFIWHGYSNCSDTYSRLSNAAIEDIKYCPCCGKALKL